MRIAPLTSMRRWEKICVHQGHQRRFIQVDRKCTHHVQIVKVVPFNVVYYFSNFLNLIGNCLLICQITAVNLIENGPYLDQSIQTVENSAPCDTETKVCVTVDTSNSPRYAFPVCLIYL